VDAVSAQEHDAAQKVSVGRQALRREVNERMRAFHEQKASYEAFCECGRVRCNERVPLGAEAYDDVRRVPARSLVKLGHAAETDRIVSAHEEFLVVENRRG
jgi:hypothetical protein